MTMTGTAPNRLLRIFICHASNDKPAVRELYRRLKADGFAPWLDEEDLLAGQDWQREIPKAVRNSDVVIVCLSRGSITKAGYVQKEIKFALDVADEQPDGTIFLIPLKLEECDVPERLSRWQWVNQFEANGYGRLTRSLRTRARELGVRAEPLPFPPLPPKRDTERETESPVVSVNGSIPARLPDVNQIAIPLPFDEVDSMIIDALPSGVHHTREMINPSTAVYRLSWSGAIYDKRVIYDDVGLIKVFKSGDKEAVLSLKDARAIYDDKHFEVTRACHQMFLQRLLILLEQIPTERRAQPVAVEVSGGVNVDANAITVGNDIVGRDKIIQTGTYIEHATIIQSGTAVQEIKPSAPTSTDNRRIIGDMEFVRVPAGQFIMGSMDDNNLTEDIERLQHTIEIPYDYWIERYPVTNEQFAKFVMDAKYEFDLGKTWQKESNHPVVRVRWRNAMAFCKWMNETLHGELKDLILRLPTEAEWEKAARGAQGYEWPWGNEFDQSKCNTSEGGKGHTTSVGAYSPHGDSPFGAADMAGNVWEWCHSLKKPYPYQATDGRENAAASGSRVLRGGSWSHGFREARCAHRAWRDPSTSTYRLGFRVVLAHGLF